MNASFPSILLDRGGRESASRSPQQGRFSPCRRDAGWGLGKPAEFGIDDMEAVFLACPYDTWKQTFGEPRDIQEHHALPASLPYRRGSSLAVMGWSTALGISWTIPTMVNGLF